MSGLSTFSFVLLQMSVGLLFTAIAVHFALRWLGIRQAGWHRAAWALVLCQGVMLAAWTTPWHCLPDADGTVTHLADSGRSTDPRYSARTSETAENAASFDTLSGAQSVALNAASFTLPMSTGPSSTGPSSTGPSSTGPSSTGPSNTGPSNTGPSNTGPSNTGPSNTVPLLDSSPVVPDRAGFPAVASERIEQSVESPKENWPASRAMVTSPLSDLRVERLSQAIGLVLFLLWLSGLVIILSVFARRYWNLTLRLQETEDAPEAWRRQWLQVQADAGVHAPIPLRVDSELGPCLCRMPRGYVVVVPRQLWSRLSPNERSAVLHHELAHWRRGDIGLALAANAVATLHWFNPAAWWAARRFEEAAEWACDEAVSAASPQQAPAFARALLELVESEAAQIGLSGAAGATLATRIRRVLAGRTRDRWPQRLALICLIAVVMPLGMMRLELKPRQAMAQDGGSDRSETTRNDQPTDHQLDPDGDRQEVLRKRLALLGEQFEPTSDVGRQLKQRLKSDAVALAVRDRVGWIEDELRRDAIAKALPEYLSRYIVSVDGRATLRGDAQAKRFVEQFVARTTEYEQDLAAIRSQLDAMANRLVDDTDEAKLLKRFMQHDASATLLYFRELRHQLRPDADTILERFDDTFVRINDQIVIRSSRRDEAARVANQCKLAGEIRDRIASDLAEFAKEMSDQDPRARQLKQAIEDGTIGTLAAAHIARDVGEDRKSSAPRIDEFFERLEWITVDRADGLVINQEASDEVDQLLQELQRIDYVREKLGGPLRAFASQIAPRDQLHRDWAELLKSPLATVRLAEDYEVVTVDAAEATEAKLSQFLESGDDGKLRLREDVWGELSDGIQEAFSEFRTMRRRTRPLEAVANQLDHADLKAAFCSTAGRMVVIHQVRDDLLRREFDGWERWVDQLFERTDDSYRLRPEAEEEVGGILEDARRIDEELSQNDF